MKYLALFLVLAALNSCNTVVGVGRDVKAGYNWTKDKINQANSGYDSGYSDTPIY